MYKRRARLLFIHPLNHEKAQHASRMAMQVGQEWLESRGTCHDDYIADTRLAEYREWADLVIHLGTAPSSPLPLGPQAQLRCWELQEDENWPQMLSHKIQGVIGGLRMLARLDAGSNPAARNTDRK